MKKVFIFLAILISMNCYARSVFDLFVNKQTHNTGLSSYFEFDDLYFYENSRGEEKYLNRKSSGICFQPKRNFIDKCEIKINQWDFYLNNLNNLDNRIKARSKAIELILDSNYKEFDFGASAKYVKNALNYNIDDFIGEIPLSYYQSKLNLKYKNLTLNYNSMFGKESENKYDNEVKGFSARLSYDHIYKNMVFTTQGSYTNFSADLQKDNSIFCELNEIQILQYSCSGKYYLHSYNSFSTGIMGIATWQRERSFFNAEPFINYYSLFFGSKTFIKKLNFNLVMPFISYEQLFRYKIINFNAALDYYHLFNSSDIVYTERKWLILGIWPDDSTKHNLELIPNIDGILRFQIQGNIEYKSFNFEIMVNQLLPVDYSVITKPYEPATSDKTKTTERGGTSVSLTVGYIF